MINAAPSTEKDAIYYEYSDRAWKELLTLYDGQMITYDAIGNPLTYRDGMSFTWQRGKELKTASKDGHTATYQYDTSGIRTDKTVDGSTTHYMLSGDKVVYETGANGNLWYRGNASFISISSAAPRDTRGFAEETAASQRKSGAENAVNSVYDL